MTNEQANTELRKLNTAMLGLITRASDPEMKAALNKARRVVVDLIDGTEGKPSRPSKDSDPLKSGAMASESGTASGLILSYADAKPDVLLAKLAKTIAESEGIDFGEAMVLALKRDPDMAERYAERDRGPDASSLQLAEGTSPVKTPPGKRLITRPADVELTEKAKARATADDITFGEAVPLILADDAPLASRYQDFRDRRTALAEADFRARTILAANRGRGRLTPDKALAAALAEDPVLRAGVDAYYEPAR